MKKYLSIFIPLLILILPCWALGATYFVTQNGSGIADGSSYANSMSVSAHNSGSFSPGDTIYLCDTITTQVKPPSDGNSSNRITYRGDYPGHAGALDFRGNPQFSFHGIDYMNIQGLTFRNGKIGIATLGSSDYVTIRRCTIHNMESKGMLISYSTKYYKGDDPLTWNTNIVIGGAPGDGNDIYNCGSNTGGQDISLRKVYHFTISYNELYATTTSYGIDGVSVHTSHNGVIEFNEVHDHNYNTVDGEDGIETKNGSHDIDIRYNHIYNHNYESGIEITDASQNINVYGNSIHNNRENILVFSRDRGYGLVISDIAIWSNLIYDAAREGIALIRDGVSTIQDVRIYNNVIAGNATNPTKDYHTGIRLSYLASGSTNEIKNNIFYKNRPYHADYMQIYVKDGYDSRVTLSNNIAYWPGHTSTVYGGKTFSDTGTNHTEGDPGLTDHASHDYTLSPGSICIGGGLDLGSPYDLALDPVNTDWASTPPVVAIRSRDKSGWDQGAYLYTGGVARKLSSPTNLRLKK